MGGGTAGGLTAEAGCRSRLEGGGLGEPLEAARGSGRLSHWRWAGGGCWDGPGERGRLLGALDGLQRGFRIWGRSGGGAGRAAWWTG